MRNINGTIAFCREPSRCIPHREDRPMQPSTQTSTRAVPFLDLDDVTQIDIVVDQEVRDPGRINKDVADVEKNMILASISFAQQALYARPYVFKLAYRVTANRTEAEDIAQETFLRAWINYPTFDATRSFEGWVGRIALNLCLDLKRRQARRPTVSLSWPSPD